MDRPGVAPLEPQHEAAEANTSLKRPRHEPAFASSDTLTQQRRASVRWYRSAKQSQLDSIEVNKARAGDMRCAIGVPYRYIAERLGFKGHSHVWRYVLLRRTFYRKIVKADRWFLTRGLFGLSSLPNNTVESTDRMTSKQWNYVQFLSYLSGIEPPAQWSFYTIRQAGGLIRSLIYRARFIDE